MKGDSQCVNTKGECPTCKFPATHFFRIHVWQRHCACFPDLYNLKLVNSKINYYLFSLSSYSSFPITLLINHKHCDSYPLRWIFLKPCIECNLIKKNWLKNLETKHLEISQCISGRAVIRKLINLTHYYCDDADPHGVMIST